MVELEIGETYSFDVYPTAVLGNNFKNVTVMAIVDSETAKVAIPGGFDPVAIHANVYGMLPDGTPNNYSRYLYVKIKHPNGAFSMLGLPWINQNTIEVKGIRKGVFTIEGIKAADVEIIKAACAGAGYKVASYELM